MQPQIQSFVDWFHVQTKSLNKANLGAKNPLSKEEGILGKWVTESGKSNVEIGYCSGASVMVNNKAVKPLCAKILWLRDPVYPKNDKKKMDGKRKVDRENPDPKLRDRPLIGLEVVRNLVQKGPKNWEDGLLYDPENGKTYQGCITLVNPNELRLRGYILGIKFLGRTSVWTRPKA